MHHIEPGHQPDRRSRQASIIVFDPSPISLLTVAGTLDSAGYRCVCARTGAAAVESLSMGTQDLIVCDVADDAEAVLDTLAEIRGVSGYESFPAVLLAESRWEGLEKRVETMRAATRCLFKPIDPNALLAVIDQSLWMPSLVAHHRRRGTRPNRPGWIQL